MNHKEERGSFLIELIIALVIMGVVFNIAILDRDLIYKFRANKEALELKRDLDRTRIDSLKRGTKSQVHIDENKSYRLISKGKKDINDTVSRRKKFEVLSVSNAPLVYRFNRNGTPVTAGTIILKHRHGSWELTVSPVTGKTNLKK